MGSQRRRCVGLCCRLYRQRTVSSSLSLTPPRVERLRLSTSAGCRHIEEQQRHDGVKQFSEPRIGVGSKIVVPHQFLGYMSRQRHCRVRGRPEAGQHETSDRNIFVPVRAVACRMDRTAGFRREQRADAFLGVSGRRSGDSAKLFPLVCPSRRQCGDATTLVARFVGGGVGHPPSMPRSFSTDTCTRRCAHCRRPRVARRATPGVRRRVVDDTFVPVLSSSSRYRTGHDGGADEGRRRDK